MDGDLLTLRNTSGTRQMDVQYGEIESIYNGELAMKFGGYTMEFYNQRNDQIGRIGPMYSLGAQRPGLGVIVEKEIINIGYNVDGIYRPTFRSDKADEADGRPITTVNGPFNNANEGSRLYLYANRRIVSSDTPFENDFNAQDQPSIFLDQSNSTNNVTLYYGGVNRRQGAEFNVRWRVSRDNYRTRLTAHDGGVNVQGTFTESSSRELKTNIRQYRDKAMDVINDLSVVEYNLKEDVESGIEIDHVGFIAEDSPAIASPDGKSIIPYQAIALNTRGLQEHDATLTDILKRLEKIENAG